MTDKVYAAVVKVSADPDVKSRLEGLGAAPVGNKPAEFAKQISEEIAKNKRIAKEANVKID
ncbi:tripartite tricarboxylate transporter receptor family protein [Bordetella holmesii 41130]|nr:tripartite tricarboxylate transporter receptor family protein [Bordetella holmesii 41130]